MTSLLGEAPGCIALALALASCSSNRSADAEWPLHGLDEMAQRFAPIEQISRGNVDRLGLVFSHDLGTDRGALAVNGMPSFAGKLTPTQLNDIHSFIEARSFEDLPQE